MQRLGVLLSSSAVVSPGVAGNFAPAQPAPSAAPPEREIQQSGKSVAKLVFGRLHGSREFLAAHSSHSSHRSHSSHSSHSSHYSGTSAPAPRSNYVPASTLPEPVPIVRPLPEVLRKLPNLRSHWPKTVRLKQRVSFNLVNNGAPVGITSMEAGAVVRLIEVKPQHAVVLVQGSNVPLPVEQSDLIEQMGGASTILLLKDDAPATSGVVANDDSELLAKLVKLKNHWPSSVALLERCDFPILEGGRQIGTRSVEVGTQLKLLSVEPHGVVVVIGGATSVVRVNQTDLVKRLGGPERISKLLADDLPVERTATPSASK